VLDEALMLFKRITRLHKDESKPWIASEAFQRLVQRCAVAIQVGNARVFDRVAQYNRVAGLQAPNVRNRIAVPRPRPARTPPPPQIRIEVPADSQALAIVDDAGVRLPANPLPSRRVSIVGDSADHPIELPSTPEHSEHEQSEPEDAEQDQSEPSDDEVAFPSERDIEVGMSYNVDWSSVHSSADSEHSDSGNSDADVSDGFARDRARNGRVEIGFDVDAQPEQSQQQRRQRQRRSGWSRRHFRRG
jgi:hypothetical protein